MKMIRLRTQVDSLRKLVLYPLPTKPVDVAVMVRTERVTVAVSSAGRIYTSQVDQRSGYLQGVPLSHTIACLQKLGVLTDAAIREHEAIVAQKKQEERRKWACSTILNEAVDAGLKLSPLQRARLVEHASQ